jgi:hypothetical protein
MLTVVGFGVFLVCGLLVGGVVSQAGQSDCVLVIVSTAGYGVGTHYYTFYSMSTYRMDEVKFDLEVRR